MFRYAVVVLVLAVSGVLADAPGASAQTVTTPSGDLLSPPSPFMCCSLKRTASLFGGNKADFCRQQKIIFQAAGAGGQASKPSA